MMHVLKHHAMKV